MNNKNSLKKALLVSKMLRATRLLCEKTNQITNAEAYVFSDSVLCVGQMGDDPIATWKRNFSMVFGKQSLQRSESNRRQADGVRVENITRNHNVGPPRADSKSDERSNVRT